MTVTFVCAANTCRSPMLEAMFANYAHARGRDDINILSAGVEAHSEPVNEYTLSVLKKHGVPFKKRNAASLDKATFEKSDIIFTMSDAQRDALCKAYGEDGKVISLSSVCGEDVFDPYGGGEDDYERVYRIFEGVLDKIAEKVFSLH